MKRMISLLLALLLLLPLSGCKPPEEPEAFSVRWRAAEDADPNAFGEAEEGTGYWSVAPLSSSQAYFDDVVMSRKESVPAGNFRFTVSAAISDNNVANVNIESNFMTMLLRVVDDATGDAVAVRELRVSDFTGPRTFQIFGLPFSLPERTLLRFEACWFNTAKIWLDECSVAGIPPEEYLVDDLTGYLTAAEDIGSRSDGTLYWFDLYSYLKPIGSSAAAYDVSLAVSALQGLANRAESRLMIRFNGGDTFMEDHDSFWREELSGPGGPLAGKQLVEVKSFATLLALFSDCFGGLVYWDDDVPATVNAACTAAGVESLLPVRYSVREQSLCRILSDAFPDLAAKLDLTGKFRDGGSGSVWDTSVPTTGSAKNDAYLWAKAKYLDTGLTHPTLMANHLDAYTWDKSGTAVSYYDIQQCFLANKDYYIQNKAFFWDLNVWEDSIPNDDKTQARGTDYRTLTSILTKQNELADGRLIEVGGFVPWYVKYTSSAGYGTENLPAPVATEWQWAKLCGIYYAVKDADAYPWTSLANASVYSRVPLRDSYSQPGNRADWTDKQFEAYAKSMGYLTSTGELAAHNYVMIYMGDWDSAAWAITGFGNIFNDANLGYLPVTFPVNFSYANRVPFLYGYLYDRAAEAGKNNVYFAGDHNGYGYLDLEALAGARPAGLKGSLDSFFELTQRYWDRFDLSIQSFLINITGKKANGMPCSDEVLKKVSALASGGVVVNEGLDANVNVRAGGNSVPWSRSLSIANGATWDAARDVLKVNFASESRATFTQLRIIACNPTFLRKVWDSAAKEGAKLTAVDQYTYMWLLKRHNEENGRTYDAA